MTTMRWNCMMVQGLMGQGLIRQLLQMNEGMDVSCLLSISLEGRLP